MAYKLNDLRNLSEQQLIQEYDKVVAFSSPSVDFYRQEIYRREQERQTQTMLYYTLWITIMTGIMTVVTVINVVISFKLLK